MPDPIIQLIVANKFFPKLDFSQITIPSINVRPANGVIDKYLATGSIGSDIFLYHDNPYYDRLSQILGYMDQFEDFLQVMNTNIINGTTGVFHIDDLATQLLGLVQTTGATIVTSIISIGLSTIDWYCTLNHSDIQTSTPEANWNWAERLKTRLTGKYANNLVNIANSNQDDNQKLFALGNFINYSTSLAGNPFKNAIAGHPPRIDLHSSEGIGKWMAAHCRKYFPDQSVVTDYIKQNTGLNILNGHDPESIKGSYYYGLVMQEQLDPHIVDQIKQAMSMTYTSYSPLGINEIQDSYNKFYKVLRYQTKGSLIQEPTPPPDPLDYLDQYFQDYLNSFPASPVAPGGLLPNIAFFFEHLCDYVTYLLDCVLHTLEFLATIAVVLTANIAAWLVYFLNQAIYTLYDNLRFLITLMAYCYPQSKDLDCNPWGKCFINTQNVNGTYQNERYPFRVDNNRIRYGINHHLKYPDLDNIIEREYTIPCPLAFENVNANVVVEGIPTSQYYKILTDVQDSPTPLATRNNIINNTNLRQYGFGSALEFACKLTQDYLNNGLPLTNMNLEADRIVGGRTFKTTDINIIPIVEDYID